MNRNTKITLVAALGVLGLFACTKQNPDNVLNPESSQYDAELAKDENGNGVADGLEPYMEACGGDAKCAADLAYEAKKDAAVSSEADASSEGTSEGASSTELSSGEVPNGSSEAASSGGTSTVTGSSAKASSGAANSSAAGPSSASITVKYALTVEGGVISTGGTTGSFAEGAQVTVYSTFAGGLDICKGSWTYTPEVVGDFPGDTAKFVMPKKNVTFTMGTRDCQDTLSDVRWGGMTYPYAKLSGTNKNWLMTNLNAKGAGSHYCYGDAPQNCIDYGRLYTVASAAGICPSGWRLPKASEMELEAGNLNLQAAGRRDEYGAYAYLEVPAQTSYLIDTVGIGAAAITINPKGCAVASEKCAFVYTNTIGGDWGVASVHVAKAYPIRCIQE